MWGEVYNTGTVHIENKFALENGMTSGCVKNDQNKRETTVFTINILSRGI